jgi:hypothetical protein
MKIQTQQDVEAANGRFNGFHDGFVKRILVTTDNEFLTDMPWETQRQFESNEEELRAAGRCAPCPGTTAIEIDIHHYNYDWPNQPRRRYIILRAQASRLWDRLVSFIGRDIFDLSFTKDGDSISCVLTHHAEDAGPVRTMENGTTTELFSASAVEIDETEWADRDREPHR